MLFKQETGTAKEAGLFLDHGDFVANIGAPEPANAPIPEDPELAMLRTECAELRARLASLQSDWTVELAKAGEQARKEAADQHLRNDRDRLAALTASLQGAKLRFEDDLQSVLKPAVEVLAKAAIERFVQLRESEEDWLGRIIARRLAALASRTIVALAVPESMRASDGQMLGQAEMPAGTKIHFDSMLSPGEARIDLALGSIPIKPRDGLRRLLAELEAGDEHD